MHIPNYSIEREDRKCKKGGGIVVYISVDISFKRRYDLESGCIESIWIEITNNRAKYLIGFIYRPPNCGQEWIDHFSSELSKIDLLNLEYHVFGDFNIDYTVHTKSFSNRKWNDLQALYGLKQLVEEPTRVTSKSSTVIDHIYTNNREKISEVYVPKLGISDHYPICFTRK